MNVISKNGEIKYSLKIDSVVSMVVSIYHKVYLCPEVICFISLKTNYKAEVKFNIHPEAIKHLSIKLLYCYLMSDCSDPK